MRLDEDFREGLIKMGKESLEKTVADNEPFLPKMLIDSGGELTTMVYPQSFEALTAVAAFLISEGKPVQGIALTVDTYHLIAPKGEEIQDAERYAGRLEIEFNNGNPMVCEALHLNLVTESHVMTVSIPYVRKPGRKVEWRDEITVDDADAEQTIKGRFPDLLREIIRATNMEGSSE